MYQVKKRSWGPAKPDPATGSALEWPRLFSYGGLAAFAQAEAPLGPDRMSERLLSVLSGPPGRMPGGDSATVPQLRVSVCWGPDLYELIGTVGLIELDLVLLGSWV